MKHSRFSIRINDKLLAAVKRIAQKERRSLNWIINRAIEQEVTAQGTRGK